MNSNCKRKEKLLREIEECWIKSLGGTFKEKLVRVVHIH